MTSIADLRREYAREALDETQVAPDPIVQFDHWLDQAITARVIEPNAMTVCTVDASGAPSARLTLLKGVDARGFVFFTNFDSRKARDLAADGRAALVFWWAELERQVRVEGTASRVDDAESDAYFASRPRGSQLGAWASPQSTPISRDELERRLREVAERFGESSPVTRPPNWGGFRVAPAVVEFWQGRPNRLHDRIVYRRAGSTWTRERLAP